MADQRYQFLLNTNETLPALDYDYLEQEDLQMHPFVQMVGQVVFFVYIFVVTFGIPANVYVLWRMYRLAKDDNEKYTNGTGVGLLTMATADLLSLILISVHNVLHSIPLDASPAVKDAVCKALLFSTHIVTSVSIWSWLLMSTLRYLAVRHPLFHLRLWQIPYRAIALIVFLSSLTNVWLLIAVNYDQSGCTLISTIEGNAILKRYLLLIESVWSFCIPVIIIIYMDVMVLICRPRNFLTANALMHTNVITLQKSKNAKAKSALRKWLVISFIDVLLNTPENVYRLVVLLGMPIGGPDGAQYHYAAQVIAQMLYFAQFAFNSVYLALFVFDNSTKPRRRTTATNYTLCEMSIAGTGPSTTMSRLRPQSHREAKRNDMCSETVLNLPRRSSWVHLISKARKNEADWRGNRTLDL